MNVCGRIFLALLLMLSLHVGSAVAQSGHRYIVSYRDSVQDHRNSFNGFGGTRVRRLPLINASVYTFAKKLSNKELQAIKDGSPTEIEFIEEDLPVTAFGDVNGNDLYSHHQWGFENDAELDGTDDVDIDINAAWRVTKGRKDVIVAVLDSGIDYTHPDLSENIWVNQQEVPNNGIDDDFNGVVDDIHGVNFVDYDGDPFDENGHGTHVAGTIGAVHDNGIGVAGVAPGVTLLGIKVLGADGSGRVSSIIHGIEYAINQKNFWGVNIVAINASLGWSRYSEAGYKAIERAQSAGISFIAAAGNDSSNLDTVPSYPASYDLDNIVSVAALARDGTLASFSNYSYRSVDISAPGESILSTYPQHLLPEGTPPYVFLSGTSMAAPHVTGVIALAHSSQPTTLSYRSANSAVTFFSKLHPTVRENTRYKVGRPAIVSAWTAIREIGLYRRDSDADGVADEQELFDRTDPNDRGDFVEILDSPAFSKYNTFLNQANFLELLASGRETARIEINVFRNDGSIIDAAIVTLEPGEQYHVDINSIVQQVDTYGLVKISFNSEAKVSGRMSHYRPSSDGQRFSFAFARELRNPVLGKTYATSNTIDPQGLEDRFVANWAELINLEGQEEVFTHRVYNQAGYLLYSQEITVPPLAEVDVQGGHEYGPGVYLNEFAPHNPNARYFASISRYRVNEAGNDFSYAYGIDAKSGSGAGMYVATFNQRGACWSQTNWLEVVNVTSRSTQAHLVFRNNQGAVVGEEVVSVPPKAQRHYNASALLGANTDGWVSVKGADRESLLAQSLVYYHDCQSNTLQTSFVIPARTRHPYTLTGTFNTNLGLDNIVSIINPEFDRGYGRATLRLNYPTRGITFGLTLNKLESAVGSVNTTEPWTVNEYGTIELEPGLGGSASVVAYNLITKTGDDGRVWFVIPSPIKR